MTNQSLAPYYSTPQLFTLKVERPTPGQWVDLGLPSGIKWAGWNVGASAPEEYGGYFAWGETSEKSVYDVDSYQHMEIYGYYSDGTPKRRYKYISDCISGTSYDVATVRWGGGARMPTREEIDELCDECYWEGGYLNGVEGAFVIGPNGNSIFIPFAGSRSGRPDIINRDNIGYYWSGTLNVNLFAYNLSRGWYGGWGREYGLTVRPVSD